MKKNDKTGRWHSNLEVQDHYVVLSEPESKYIPHVTPETGHGKMIALSIFHYLKKNSFDTDKLICTGSDGTNVNVGAEKGAIHFLEILLGKELHNFICQLHGNELPFRAIFYHYDGKPQVRS